MYSTRGLEDRNHCSHRTIYAEQRSHEGRADRIRRIERERRRCLVRRQRLGLALGLLLIISSFTVLSGFTHAERQSGKYLYYTSVTVDKDDTLYGIASEYVNMQPRSLEGFMKQIMELNHMKAPTVYYGQVIVVPYYSDELK